jgi:AraC family transcriptional regulator of adaptative response / DNA-3-methyladenine glycosylase II
MRDLDRDACYRALQARDARFDGRFFTCVTSTGIYCRPICPARTPKLANCIFMPSAAAAHAAGFRSCLRCRPEIAPGLAGWRGTASTVSRALALIAEGGLDGEGTVEQLAERLGVGARHLRRLFDEHLGTAPVAVAQAHRILFAKQLIGETMLPMAEIALAAGFGSIRRFNSVMRRTYGRPPSGLRRAKARAAAPETAAITLRLPFTPPYNWPAMMAFLKPRAIPGVELVEPERYSRTFAIEGALGTIEVVPVAGASCLRATIRAPAVTALATVVGRLRRLFDLDADTTVIESHLARAPRLAPAIAARPGLRVPGAWDHFELAIRAMLGQQVSVAAATTLAGRLAATYGEAIPASAGGRAGLDRLFPRPQALATADLAAIGMPGARARAIAALAAAMVADNDLLRPFDTLEATIARLRRLPGIGSWTAQYIAMRALREPDAFPASDLGLLRAMATAEGRPSPAALLATAEAWRPWRAYAALHLWMSEAPPPPARTPAPTRQEGPPHAATPPKLRMLRPRPAAGVD